MEYNKEYYSIKLDKNKLIFSGKIEEINYNEISIFLTEATKDISEDELIIDLTNLKFLNSLGVRILAAFMLKYNKKILILIDPQITWQKVGIVPLTKLKSAGLINIKQ